MSAPWNEWDWDYVVHAAVGAAITAATAVGLHFTPFPRWLVVVLVLSTIPITTGGGILREKIQHHFDRLTAHQWLEGVLFGVGSTVAAVPCLLLL
jgi:hypothetical protein